MELPIKLGQSWGIMWNPSGFIRDPFEGSAVLQSSRAAVICSLTKNYLAITKENINVFLVPNVFQNEDQIKCVLIHVFWSCNYFWQTHGCHRIHYTGKSSPCHGGWSHPKLKVLELQYQPEMSFRCSWRATSEQLGGQHFSPFQNIL